MYVQSYEICWCMHEGLDLYERTTCRYVRLNAWNVPHVPRPCFIAPSIYSFFWFPLSSPLSIFPPLSCVCLFFFLTDADCQATFFPTLKIFCIRQFREYKNIFCQFHFYLRFKLRLFKDSAKASGYQIFCEMI